MLILWESHEQIFQALLTEQKIEILAVPGRGRNEICNIQWHGIFKVIFDLEVNRIYEPYSLKFL